MRNKKYYLFAIAICWTAFILWEIMVHQWAKNIEGPLIRVDLVLILPLMLLITAFSLFKAFSQKD